jgi:hypothetical protein
MSLNGTAIKELNKNENMQLMMIVEKGQIQG